ncbi:MAG: UPF0182 family protein [Acidimicrobiia bacterium]|nr:MAG: UPF0182 family protein [Acidimicrobiia bacterium]
MIGVAVVFFLLIAARWLATLWTDFLWYDELDAGDVWVTLTFTKVWLILGATILAVVVFWANLWIVDRLSPRSLLALTGAPDEELLERYQLWIEPRAFLVRTVFSVFFALLVGLGAASWWQDWLRWRNGVSFNVFDPIYGNDISLYVFGLPLYRDIYGWLFQLLLVTTLIVVGAHYLNGGIKVTTPGDRTSGAVKAHISVLLAAIALLKSAGYIFDKWELLYSGRGQVFGASYTDVNAQVPALNLLIFISVAAAIILLVNVWFRGWMLPAIAFGIWLVTSIGVGGIYPAVVQRFSVEPNELQRELPYVQHNLDFTRLGYGLDEVEVREFNASTDLTAEAIAANRPTIENIRLWDPGVLAQTYPELQNIKTYYNFADIDVDRYVLNGELTQVMVAARILDERLIPGTGWVNERLIYTHGLGAVLSPANDVTADGFPDFLVEDIPPVNVNGSENLNIDQPRIYFSDAAERDFLIAGSREGEVDIPQDGTETTSTNSYDGQGGVPLGGFFQRAAWALRFGDLNTLISSQVKSTSRVMISRNIKDRIQRMAPFLYADNDPYMVISGGRQLWVMDLYTVTDRFPYSELASTARLNQGAELPRRFNYIRNSVKAVIDAYDGTVDMYVIDPDDPLIQTNMKIFPDLFKPISELPEGLVSHIRYPEDLFRIQTDVYTLYHMTDPIDLFQVNDPWQIARDPSNSPKAPLRGTFGTDPMLPYYLLMELPEEDRLSFLLMQPFTPAARPNMSAFVVAKSGPLEEYGNLIEFTMPEDRQVDGPGQVGDFIEQDPRVSSEFTLLGQVGSDVIKGNMLVVPVEDSLLYVQPIYLAADTGGGRNGIPQFKRVVASFNSRIEIADTLDQVLVLLFGEADGTAGADGGGAGGGDDGNGGEQPQPPSGTIQEQVEILLAQAEAAFTEADVALRAGDLAEYQRKVDEARTLVEQANQIIADAAAAASGETARFSR